MKKLVILGLVVALTLGGCVLPAIPTTNTSSTPNPNAGPTVDVAGTVDAMMKTAVLQTLTAQPTITSVPATDTPTAVLESFVPVTVESSTSTTTPIADLTSTPATATSGPADATFTATLAAANPATSIPTLTIRLWGTLPPAVPSSDIILINKSKTQAYISLQVTSPDGRYAVVEYPVVGRMEIKAPIGSYLYVAWVGGNKMVGNFRLHGNEELSITLYKDKIDVH